MRDIEADVRAVLERDPDIESVELTGSRGRGDAAPYSDWDFKITARDFARAARSLPELVSPLEPLGQFWDPLAPEWCYILMMRGPFGIDLIFDVPHERANPWTPAPENMAKIDTHFWNWIWWLSTKDRHGKSERVREELDRMQWFLLGPLGSGRAPQTIADAVGAYAAASSEPTGALALDVLAGLRRAGYAV